MAADRTSNSRLLVGGVLLCSTTSMGLAFSSEIWQLIFAMALIGGVQGAAWVPSTKLVATWFDDSSYGTMFSVLGCGSTLAGMLLPAFKQFYWRTCHLNFGLFMLAFAMICKRWVITEDGIRKEMKPRKKSELEEEEKQGIRTVVSSLSVWHIAVVYFFSMELRTVCETWIPLFLSERNQSSDGFQFFYELGGLTGTMASGILLDQLSKRFGVDPSRKWLGFAFSIVMLCVAQLVFRWADLASPIGFGTGFFVNGSINIWCLIGSQAGTNTIAGTVSAFISFIATFGSIFAGSPLAHLIARFNYDVFSWLLTGQMTFLLVVAASGISLRMRKTSSEKKND